MAIKATLISIFITGHVLANKISIHFICLISWKGVSGHMICKENKKDTHGKRDMARTCPQRDVN